METYKESLEARIKLLCRKLTTMSDEDGDPYVNNNQKLKEYHNIETQLQELYDVRRYITDEKNQPIFKVVEDLVEANTIKCKELEDKIQLQSKQNTVQMMEVDLLNGIVKNLQEQHTAQSDQMIRLLSMMKQLMDTMK
jgi:hypothetical protein